MLCYLKTQQHYNTIINLNAFEIHWNYCKYTQGTKHKWDKRGHTKMLDQSIRSYTSTQLVPNSWIPTG